MKPGAWIVIGAWAAALAAARAAPPVTDDGFAIPQPGRVFSFPRDHGSHPEFRTEWWYVTGHLDSDAGRRFGFQITFFRQARRTGAGAVEQLHLAHAALLDAASREFRSEERLNREGWDASASASTLDVRNANWRLRLDPKSGRIEAVSTVKAEVLLKLELEPVKPLVVFGELGVSRKGRSPAASSHYLTWPRLKASGRLRNGSEDHRVRGEAWMDHEFSSSQLDAGQVGWDWAAIQFRDGREVMVYRMRLADGSADPASVLTEISPDGATRTRGRDDFTWEGRGFWRSPRSKASYPNRVTVSFEGQSLELRPLADDQEQGGSLTGLPYWEGACDVLDAGGNVLGRAFLELAGYAGDLRRHLGPAAR